MQLSFPAFSFSEGNLKRWKIIQVVSILPLSLSVVLMIHFGGSMLGPFIFILTLIIGVVLPQICIIQVASHLILQEGIKTIEERLDRLEAANPPRA